MKERLMPGLWWLAFIVLMCPVDSVNAQDARALVEDSFNYFRGKNSIYTVSMTIHRQVDKGFTKPSEIPE
jgi:hypothetical protein